MKKFMSYFWLVCGSFLTALGLNLFLIPQKIAAGGVTGIATVLFYKMAIPTWLTVFVLNALLLLISYKLLDAQTAIKTIIASLLLSVFLDLTEGLVIPCDILIAAIYGGAILGLGLGMVIANGASTGGTDLLSLIIRKFSATLSVGVIMLIIDLVIITISSYVFSDFSLVLYASLGLAISIKVTDYVVDGVDFAKSVTIISKEHEKISASLMNKLERGVTGFYIKGMYSNTDQMALVCIVKLREIVKLKKIVKEIDKNAFIYLTNVTETLGEGFKR